MKALNLFLIDFFAKAERLLKPVWVKDLVFLGLFLFLIFNLDLFASFFQYPQGIHIWRQSDGFSQIMNYYYNDLDVLDWGFAYNQFSFGNRGVGEFPIHYIIQAGLMKVFGVNYWLPQIYSTILTFFGLYSLYRASSLIIKDHWVSILLSFLFFFSPIFVAYSFRMMPDAYALSTLNISFYFFTVFFLKGKKKHLWIGVLFISLTGMVKLFYLIPFIAVFFVLIVDRLLLKKYKARISTILILFIPLLLTFLWGLTIFYYNSVHGFEGFLKNLVSYWDVDSDLKQDVLNKFLIRWRHELFNNTLGKITLFLGLVTLIMGLYKRCYLLVMNILFHGIGLLIFDLLIFAQLVDHDYYFITHLPIIFIIWVSFFEVLRHAIPPNFSFKFFSGVLLLVMIFNFGLIHSQYNWRYKDWVNEAPRFQSFVKNKDSIAQFVGDKKIIVPEDFTTNFTLGIMQLEGWTNCQLQKKILSIEDMYNRGARYIVVQNLTKAELKAKTSLSIKKEKTVGDIEIYALND